MAIENEDEEYLVEAHFYTNGGYKKREVYLSDLAHLRDVITATWTETPHEVVVSENNVRVKQTTGQEPIIAIFTFVKLSDELQLPTIFEV